MIDKIKVTDQAVTEEDIFQGMNLNPPKYIVFKGFLSTQGFQEEISESSRRVLETPLFDEEGKPIKTAENWFISGHNLEEAFPPSPSK